MTCIVAYNLTDAADKEYIVLAADKMGSNGNTKRVYVKPKIFKNGDFWIGYTTSFYIGQIIQHVWEAPVKLESTHIDDYIFNDVVKSISKVFNDNNFGEIKGKESLEPEHGTFIMVYDGRIFEVFSNLAILEVYDFTSIGCGSEIMEGAINMSFELSADIDIEDLLEKAFCIVAHRSCGVSEDFDWVVIPA